MTTISKEEIMEITKSFGNSATDTGNPAVQVAIFTKRINEITEHMKVHKKDFHSRRGLLKLVSKRRKLLDYIRKNNPQDYLDLIGKLNIRK